MGGLETNVVNALVGFFVVDLILRQAITRIDSIAKMRVDSLSGPIRSSIRKLESFDIKTLSKEDFMKIVIEIESIKPLPPKAILDLAKKVSWETSDPDREVSLNLLTKSLKELLGKEKKFVSFYAIGFGVMSFPSGVTMVMSLIFFAVPILWIPGLFLYLNHALNGEMLSLLLIIAAVYEFIIHKGKRISNL